MYSHEKAVVERISSSLKERYPNDIVSVYVFGSRARGDHTDRSDFDVLVIVRKRSVAIEEAVVATFVEEEMESGLCFDPIIKSLSSFELEKRHHTPFFQNIEREGIAV
jgi:predicted nucleotidyltransferase